MRFFFGTTQTRVWLHAGMRVLTSVIAVLASPAGAAADSSLRCNNELVSVGDTRFELERTCGPPDHVASRPVRELWAGGATLERVETWTYAETGSFTRLVTIRRGKVASVRTVSNPGRAQGCVPAILRHRATVGEVFLRCGRPVESSEWIEEKILAGFLGRGYPDVVTELVVHERWVYDPGPGRLLRIFEFENGELVSVETGSRS